MTLQPELMDLPDHVLLEIAKRVGFPALPNLHKVNCRFRGLLTYNTLDSKIDKIFIDPKMDESIRIGYSGLDGDIVNVYYDKFPHGCQVTDGSRGWMLLGENYIDICCRDLQMNLRHQKSELKELCILWNQEEDELKRQLEPRIASLLRNRRLPLRVTHLYVSGFSTEHVHSILPAIDSLETLFVKPDSMLEDSMKVESSEIQRLLSLKQCKSLKNFYFNYMIRKLDILPVVAHLERVQLNVETLTLQDIVEIQTMLLNFPQMRSLAIKYWHSDGAGGDDLEHFSVLLGEPFYNGDCHYWHYHIPGAEKTILEIRIPFFWDDESTEMIFSRIEDGKVPEGATIQDVEILFFLIVFVIILVLFFVRFLFC